MGVECNFSGIHLQFFDLAVGEEEPFDALQVNLAPVIEGQEIVGAAVIDGLIRGGVGSDREARQIGSIDAEHLIHGHAQFERIGAARAGQDQAAIEVGIGVEGRDRVEFERVGIERAEFDLVAQDVEAFEAEHVSRDRRIRVIHPQLELVFIRGQCRRQGIQVEQIVGLQGCVESLQVETEARSQTFGHQRRLFEGSR